MNHRRFSELFVAHFDAREESSYSVTTEGRLSASQISDALSE